MILIKTLQVLTFPTLLTSVTATSTGDFTVAFLGTGDGRLRKAVVESASSGIEYADIEIAEGTSVRSHLLFDLKRDHVYVMTDRALSKVTQTMISMRAIATESHKLMKFLKN